MTTKDALVDRLATKYRDMCRMFGFDDGDREMLAEYDATKAEPCPCKLATCVAPWEPGCGLGADKRFAEVVIEREVAAYLHTVVQDDGHEDSALSFSADSFPFEDVGGFKSIAVQKLYASPPTRAPGIDDAERIYDNFAGRMFTPTTKIEDLLAALIDAGVRVEVRDMDAVALSHSDESIEAIAACLGDDAAMLRADHNLEEVATNMELAASALERMGSLNEAR